MGEQMDMGDEREVGPEEYVEGGKCYRCGEMRHEGKCKLERLECGRCGGMGHNRRTCMAIGKLCRECRVRGHYRTECRWKKGKQG